MLLTWSLPGKSHTSWQLPSMCWAVWCSQIWPGNFFFCSSQPAGQGDTARLSPARCDFSPAWPFLQGSSRGCSSAPATVFNTITATKGLLFLCVFGAQRGRKITRGRMGHTQHFLKGSTDMHPYAQDLSTSSPWLSIDCPSRQRYLKNFTGTAKPSTKWLSTTCPRVYITCPMTNQISEKEPYYDPNNSSSQVCVLTTRPQFLPASVLIHVPFWRHSYGKWFNWEVVASTI